MAAKIANLIDKKDTFEIVRDKIASILTEEEANQRALATAAAKDPDEWKFNVFIERAIPWELLQDANGNVTSETPLINVYFNAGSFPENKSNTVSRQAHEGTFYIDCYAAKNDLDNLDNTITPGDLRASLEADRITRLVRNIIMSAHYIFLDLQGIVWKRWITDITKFQPSVNDVPASRVMATRISLMVTFNETSPQWDTVDLEGVNVELNLSPTGQVLLDFDYT